MSFVAVAVGGSAVLGYASSRRATRAASQAANEQNETMRDAAQLQYDLGKETLDFNLKYYNETVKPAADFDLQTRRELTPLLTQSFRDQEAFATQQRQDYLDNWRPVEERVRSDAMGYDSDANVNRRMGIAAANVNQQFSNAAGQNARLLTRYGLNPNSSAFARTNANLTAQQALASAGMQTGAAFDTMDRGIALRAGAANFGRNMPNTAASFGQLGNQTANNAAGITAGGVNTAGAAAGIMNRGYGLAGDINASSAGISNNIFRNNLGMAQMQAGAVGDLFGGIGQGLGMWGRGGFGGPGMDSLQARFSNTAMGSSGFGSGLAYGNQDLGQYLADGGQVDDGAPVSTGMTPDGRNFGLVRGPGTAISDEIPAVNVDEGRPLRLGNKEYVVPGDVVEKLGTLYFDKLIEKHHTPAEIQRMGLARSA